MEERDGSSPGAGSPKEHLDAFINVCTQKVWDIFVYYTLHVMDLKFKTISKSTLMLGCRIVVGKNKYICVFFPAWMQFSLHDFIASEEK